MKQSAWVISVLLASVFLLAYAVPDLTRRNSAQPVLASSIYDEPLQPSDRKEFESVALEFTNHYYTYTLDNYREEGLKLLPLLTTDYQESFKKLVENGFVAAKAVQAESTVISTQILAVERTAPDKGFVYLHFEANVSNNGKETLNRYSTTLGFKKEAGHWRINGILSEQPVKFINIKNLL